VFQAAIGNASCRTARKYIKTVFRETPSALRFYAPSLCKK